ncbi:hypothetical protein QBD01_001506 [Ochrobactrum sp. 19YEA23]|uniref:hypothetical protein n=1 Tax=Ochrobactrum sp. 19YEA23 TaxID=3039854 RepID=UPI002479CE98|nr:hypothetical protein [Ochrobactrum sp. 19YEA23]
MRGLDFTSWQSMLLTLISLALFTLITIGIRLLMMFTIQQRRERMNRQINERLRTLIAAYKILGGSFTGDLSANPIHLKEIRQHANVGGGYNLDEKEWDRPRRIRDAVEAALSEVILLGTDEQVKLAVEAANALIVGEPVKTEALVVSLRNFIREALALEPVSAKLIIPQQGPARPVGTAARKGKDQKGGDSGGKGHGGVGGGVGGNAGFNETPAEDSAQYQSR